MLSMNKKTVNVLLLLAIVILSGAPASLALPQYLTDLNTVYGNGSCETCHVNATGGGSRTPYGILFENQPNHATNASAALIAIGAPPAANQTVMPTAISTPAATSIATTVTITETTEAMETPKSPGFEIVSSLLGLFAFALLAKRNNR